MNKRIPEVPIDGRLILIKSHKIKENDIFKYDELDVAAKLHQLGIPDEWVLEVHASQMNGKQIIAQVPDFDWFEAMKFTDWPPLKKIKIWVESCTKEVPIENNNNNMNIKKELPTENIEIKQDRDEFGDINENRQEFGDKKKKKNGNNKSKKKKKKSINNDYSSDSIGDEYETINWDEKPVKIFKQIDKVKLEELDLSILIENFEWWYGKLSKNNKTGINRLISAFAKYLIYEARLKHKTFPKYVVSESKKLGIKTNWNRRVVDGFKKIWKFYLASNIGELFRSKKQFVGGHYNPMKFRFRNEPVELDRHYGISKPGNYFIKKYNELYEKYLEEEEYYTPDESDNNKNNNNLSINEVSKKNIEEYVNESNKLSTSQKDGGWIEIPTPEFGKEFWKKIWCKRTKSEIKVGLFVQNKYYKENVYYWNGKIYININDITDIITEVNSESELENTNNNELENTNNTLELNSDDELENKNNNELENKKENKRENKKKNKKS